MQLRAGQRLDLTESGLRGTPALVTGASRGFGRAIAVALHHGGADVVADARIADQLGQLREELGSPLSGGYAGAKAAIRFVSSYAADESMRAGLGIRFVSVLPQLTPATDLGAAAVAAYAKRKGIDMDEFVAQQGPALDPVFVGRQIAGLASSTDPAGAYLLKPDGLFLLP